MQQYKQGDIVWTDLTIPNADEVKDFYKTVVGWDVEPHAMGEYNDYVMKTAEGTGVAGVCHARGTNANIPPQWMVYVAIADVEGAAKRCVERGGKVLDGPRKMGDKDFACIQDPAGAVLALISI